MGATRVELTEEQSLELAEGIAGSSLAYDDWWPVADEMKRNLLLPDDYMPTFGEMYSFVMENPHLGLDRNIQSTIDIVEHDPAYLDVFRDWRLIGDYDTNEKTGYYALFIEAGPDRMIVAFRGSEEVLSKQGWLDWVQGDVGQLNSFETVQQHENGRMLQYLVDSGLAARYSIFDFTGHSLGSNTSIDATLKAAGFGINVRRCTAIDGPGFSLEYLYANLMLLPGAAPRITEYNTSAVGHLLWGVPGASVVELEAKAPPKAGRGGDCGWVPAFVALHDLRSPAGGPAGGYAALDGPLSPEKYLAMVLSRWLSVNPLVKVATWPHTALSLLRRYGDGLAGLMEAAFLMEAAGAQAGLEAQWALIDDLGRRARESMALQGEALELEAAALQAEADARRAFLDGLCSGLWGLMAMQAEADMLAWEARYGAFMGGLPGMLRELVGMLVDAELAAPPPPGAAPPPPAPPPGSGRRRDFSDAARAEVLAVLDSIMRDRPFDVRSLHYWPRFERILSEHVPEALECFRPLADFHDLFEADVLACRAEVVRIFDEANAIDRACAGELGAINEELRQLLADIRRMREALEAAAAEIGGLG